MNAISNNLLPVGCRVRITESCFVPRWAGLRGEIISINKWVRHIGHSYAIRTDDGQILTVAASSVVSE